MIITKCVKEIEIGLPKIVEQRSDAYSSEIAVCVDKQSKRVIDIDEFIEFQDDYEESKNKFDELDEEFQNFRDLADLMKDDAHRIKIPEDCNVMPVKKLYSTNCNFIF